MFQCKENCSECCGIVPIPLHIFEKNKHLIEKEIEKIEQLREDVVIPITKDLKCAFVKDNRCLIYKERPWVCRAYGTALPCPYIKPNGNSRSEANQKKTQRKINHDVDKRLKKPKWKIKRI